MYGCFVCILYAYMCMDLCIFIFMYMYICMRVYIWMCTCVHICRVRINVSWFGKYNVFFIFHNIVFPTYSENHDTKEDFCFLNQGTKTKLFLAIKVKNDFNMMRISFLLKQLCCFCLGIRFFSVISIGVSFCNSFQLYFLFLSMHWYTEDCFTIIERSFKLVHY